MRYGKIKRNTYRRGTGAYRCSQSISEGRTTLQNLQKSWQVKVKGSQKWVGRYNNLDKSSDKEWFKENSRAPKNVHRKTDPEVEQLIIKVRKSLMEGRTEDTKYRCIGADEIQFRIMNWGTQKMVSQACQQSNALSKETVW